MGSSEQAGAARPCQVTALALGGFFRPGLAQALIKGAPFPDSREQFASASLILLAAIEASSRPIFSDLLRLIAPLLSHPDLNKRFLSHPERSEGRVPVAQS